MTDEQINWAITKAIGADPHWKCAKDYCNDLNAMHEAEKVLDYEKCEAFSNAVADIVHAANREKDYPFPLGFARIHATAWQRAEALLKVLGKWEEVQG